VHGKETEEECMKLEQASGEVNGLFVFNLETDCDNSTSDTAIDK
jgi:hypothetical protein